jgi:hypothetical protein
LFLILGCLSGRNDPDFLIILPVAMAYHQAVQDAAQSKKDEPGLVFRMFSVMNQSG